MADRILIALLGIVSSLALLQILLMGFGRDQGIYAVVADAVLSGGMPYRDAWDFKPPGIYLVYILAQGLFGSNEWSIRLVEVIAFGSVVPVFWGLAKRFFGDGRIGLVGAALAIWIEAQLEFWHTSQPESFGGLLALIGLWLTTHPVVGGLSWKHGSRWFGAGLLFGLAALMKPHLVGVAVIAAGHAAWRLRIEARTWKHQLTAVAMVGAGAACTLALCLAWFASRGALGDLHHTLFVFAPGYAATTWRSGYLAYYTYSAFKEATLGFSAIAGIGIALTLGLGNRTPREKEGLWLLVAAAVPQLLGIAMQSKFFAYHYGSVLPFCALVAAPGLWKAWKWCQSAPVFGPSAFVLGLLAAADARSGVRDLPQSFVERSWDRTKALLSGNAEYRAAVDASLYSVADVHYGANMRVARWIELNTGPGDPVYVWGFEPHIYFASKRPPASRFIYNVPQRVEWDNHWARDELARTLREKPPHVVVVEHGDVFPVVTGNHEDSAAALLAYPELDQLLEDKYSFRERIQDFDIYALR